MIWHFFGNRHIPFASVSERAAQISITFAAPTKTFNMAGIVSSFAIVPNEELRNRFYGWLKANELDEPTLFAPIATIAAYRKGEEWRKQMLAYVEENVRFCRRLPVVSIFPVFVHSVRRQVSLFGWIVMDWD